MGAKLAGVLLAIYLAILLFVNATILEKHLVLVCFDIGTAAILIGAAFIGSDSNGRA